MIIGSPLFVLIGKDRCWLCEREQFVIALATTHINDGRTNTFDSHELSILRDIQSLPEDLVSHLQRNYPQFRPKFSKASQNTVYVNHCECGECFADQFLHEPGGVFAPPLREQAPRFALRALTMEGRFPVHANWREYKHHGHVGPFLRYTFGLPSRMFPGKIQAAS